MTLKRALGTAAAAALMASGLTVAHGAGTPTTLYFHAKSNPSNVQEAQSVDPTMDGTAPTGTEDKIAIATPVVGNRNFKKNELGAYWAGSFSGTIGDNPTVVFWARTATAQKLDVRLFANGAAGVSTPLGTVLVDAVPGEAQYTALFTGLEAPLDQGLVVQVFGSSAAGTNAETAVLFDSVAHPSRVTFGLSPLAETLPALNDPFGIAFDATGDFIEANSGTGHVLKVDPTTLQPKSILVTGIVPGGFARGATGVAIDGNGDVYAAIAETGEITLLTKTVKKGKSTTVLGAYARGLGTPIGLALNTDGSLFVADRAGKRVLKIEPSHKWKVVASGFAEGPYGLAFGPDGTLAVSTQADGKVFAIDVSTAPATVTEIANLNDNDPNTAFTDSAEGLAYDTGGNLYIGDGRRGRLMKRDPAGAITQVATGLGGPLHLAFRPTSGKLLIATQGEGRAAGDAILEQDVGGTGLPLAKPTGLPGPLAAIPRAWVHKGVAPTNPAVPVTGPARPVDPADFGGTLPEATARYTGENGVEPTIGIQTDGDLYMVESRNPCSIVLVLVCGRSEVFRSADEGKTWSEITPDTDQGIEMPPVSADPFLTVDRETNRIFNFDLTSACHYLSYSDDDGQTWTQNAHACAIPPADHQSIVVAEPRTVTTHGYPNVLHTCGNYPATATPCQRSLDGGDTWEATSFAYATTPLLVSKCGGGISSHLVADAEGRIFLPRVGQFPCISISEDDGESWTVFPVSSTVPGLSGDHEGRVSADSAGNLYYVWMSRDRLPYLTHSTDHGKTWSAPVMIAPPGVTVTNLPAIAAGAPGKIAVLYMGTTVEYGYAARNFAKASWNGYLTMSTDALAEDPTFTSTTANPLVDPIKRNGCGPGRCDLIFDFLDVDIDEAGRPWGTFGDMCYADCIRDRNFDTASSFAKGFVAPLAVGPRLLGGGSLSPLAATTIDGPGGGTIAIGVMVRGEEVFIYSAPAFGGEPIEVGLEEIVEEGSR